MATIDRSGAEALIPEDVASEIFKEVTEGSSIMRAARKLPNGSSKQKRLPVLSGLVQAGFVTGEVTQAEPTDGQKPTSRQLWTNKFIDYEEISVIVPISENVFDDSEFDIWGEVRPSIVESFGAVFDAGVLYGTNAPATWPVSILQGATDAGHLVTEGSVGTDLYDDIFAPGGVFSLVEEDGFDVTASIAALRLRAKLRGLRDDQQRPLFLQSMQDPGRFMLDGSDVFFPKNGALDASEGLLFSGDWSKVVWSLRKDITYKILTEAVIQDTDGSILYNLAQQDMIALRAVMRLGWQVPNPVNRVNANATTRYPIAVLAPAGT